jgi:hypothetical protein
VKQVPAGLRDLWHAGDFTGENRPMMRATVQHLNVLLRPYSFHDAKTHELRKGTFSSDIFHQSQKPFELPNLKSVDWTRDVDNDVPTVTLVFYNTQPLALGQTPSDLEDFDQPGYFTADRGYYPFSDDWSHEKTGWQGRLLPDNLIRTYEGYGFDPSVGPDLDPHMTQSGIWIITEVDESTQGGATITVTASDLLSTLVSQINFPPIVPLQQYPLSWSHYKKYPNPDIISTEADWIRPTYETDSNIPYVTRPDITDGGQPYVSPDGSIHGHHGRHAFDSSDKTYFLSVGNHSDWSSAYEWTQGTIPKTTVHGVRVKSKAGPYRMYVSLYVKGKGWIGKGKIPYRHRVVEAGTSIPYVMAAHIGDDTTKVVRLPNAVHNVTKVRVTFSHLWDSGIGLNYPYRAAIRSIEVSADVSVAHDGGTHWEGQYSDYTDLVKWWLAWAGWFWPTNHSSGAWQRLTDGSQLDIIPASPDPVIGNRGRVWGDFEQTGTYGPQDLTVDLFDKKPILDCIHYIRDIIGFNFWCDETGGAIWRMPNIYAIGNYLTPVSGGPNLGRTSSVLTIDETQTITQWALRKSSTNIREAVFVGNTSGKYAGASAGYNPNPTGLRRIGGYTDQNFSSSKECQIMADFITLRQAFTYRLGSITITANPEIQIDDQVRIRERTTEEFFYHYVKSVHSSWDLESGRWTYQLTTHWLGQTPFSRWAFNPAKLSQYTQLFLQAIGKI